MDSNKDNMISVRDLYKTFRLPHEQQSGIKQKIINHFKGVNGFEIQEVLKGVSFDIKRGDFFGIVGRNGSGKSTLLKILAGIYSPDSGDVVVNGSLTPFIELGVGFNPELTGRENLYLNGALLGFSRSEMEKMYDDIVGFAELEKFMDQKLKNYSSGMQVRLAFSIAIRAEGDILLLDEVLAVGDEAFQQKCYDYFGSLKRHDKTVILVTHDMGAVERFCTNGMLLENGKIVKIGASSEIAELYSNLFINDISKTKNNKIARVDRQEKVINFKSIGVYQNNIKTDKIKAFTPFDIEVVFNSSESISPSVCIVEILNSQNNMIISADSERVSGCKYSIKSGENRVRFCIKQNIYNQDNYYINLLINDSKKNLLLKEAVSKFEIINNDKTIRYSLTHPEVEVRVDYN